MEKICVLLALVALAQAQAQTGDIIVSLAKGQVRGYVTTFTETRTTGVSRVLNVFKGIPYAEPPMRFRPPVEKQPWEGVYDATFYRYACYQTYIPIQLLSDDCLTLNIWAPASDGSVKYPVMVNFQSGDFQSGVGGSHFSDGSPMAAMNDVVVVTFNYRLGVYGFGSSASDLVPGNMGLMDQAMALRWVRENIEAFGGDSQQVTVYGSLAGSASISLHMVSRRTRDLFDQAILQGGTFHSYWAFSENATNEAVKAVEMAYRLGCSINVDNPDEMNVLTCLTTADPARVLEISLQMEYEGKQFLPTIDGRIISENPKDMVARGDFKQCPIIGGYNNDAGTRDVLYLKPEYLNSPIKPRITEDEFYYIFEVARIAVDMDEEVGLALKLVAAQEYVEYSQYLRRDLNWFDWAAEMHGDAAYTCPTFNFTWRWAEQNSTEPVHIYQLSYAPSVSILELYNVTRARWLGATVEEELQFVVGYAFLPEFVSLGYNPPDRERELSVQIMKYWSNFAKTSNPNLPNLDIPRQTESYLTWPQYTSMDQVNLNFDDVVGVEVGDKSNVCFMWTYLIPQLRGYLGRRTGFGEDNGDDDGNVGGGRWREAFDDWQRYHEEWKETFEAYKEGECN